MAIFHATSAATVAHVETHSRISNVTLSQPLARRVGPLHVHKPTATGHSIVCESCLAALASWGCVTPLIGKPNSIEFAVVPAPVPSRPCKQKSSLWPAKSSFAATLRRNNARRELRWANMGFRYQMLFRATGKPIYAERAAIFEQRDAARRQQMQEVA